MEHFDFLCCSVLASVVGTVILSSLLGEGRDEELRMGVQRPALLIWRAAQGEARGWRIRAWRLNKSGVSPQGATDSIFLSFQSRSPLAAKFYAH
jgi:hypothetical protein